MRGKRDRQPSMFFAINVEDRIPRDHPLRSIRRMADEELARLSPAFDAAYCADNGRPSIPPEHLVKALLLQALYTIRSERQLCEHLGYNILYQWFVGLRPDAAVWDPSTFSRNRERFAEHGLLQKFFDGTVARAIREKAASCQDFAVDGTLIRSLASLKSLQPKDRDDDDPPYDGGSMPDYRGQKRSNETHESATDPESRLARKGGTGAHLSHALHTLMDTDSDVLLAIELTEANGWAERDAAITMLKRVRRRHRVRPRSLAADAGYKAAEFKARVAALGGIGLSIARTWSDQGPTAVDRVLQRGRRKIEKVIGWLKGIAGLARSSFYNRWKTSLYALAAGAAYNLLRLTGITRQREATVAA